ncbi:hypothetical protein [Arthrobacter sp. USHLN218]|uniref:hypothetical protein n=1 Tax=Arthrobacter sp. USHLN218 TaxID=3081232 RepID=UPI00301AB404
MGANEKLAATFHPDEPEHLAAHMIDVIEYPLNGDDISVTTRARPVINALLQDARIEALMDAAEQIGRAAESMRRVGEDELAEGVEHAAAILRRKLARTSRTKETTCD